MKPAGKRIKGASAEREVTKRIKDAGIKAEKISRSGYNVHDLVINDKFSEVKCRKSVPVCVYKWLTERENTSYLFMRRDREEWLVVLRLDEFIELLKK